MNESKMSYSELRREKNEGTDQEEAGREEAQKLMAAKTILSRVAGKAFVGQSMTRAELDEILAESGKRGDEAIDYLNEIIEAVANAELRAHDLGHTAE